MTTRQDASPIANWREWRTSREAGISSSYGRLSVTALEWLDSEPGGVLDLPGQWWADTAGIHVALSDADAALLSEGRPVTGAVLLWDLTGEPPELRDGARTIELVVRGLGLRGVRVRDPEAPARRAFPGIPVFDYDPDWRITGEYRRYDAPERVSVGSVLPGIQHAQEVTGEIDVVVHGVRRSLKVNDGTWIAFRDSTNGHETNHHCRWVDVDLTMGGEVVVDFNFSANPPCAFTDFATCPLAPLGNELPERVLAGERDPRTAIGG